MDQKYERIPIFMELANQTHIQPLASCIGDQKYERIPIFMELANQTHIQPLASCIGERKVFKH